MEYRFYMIPESIERNLQYHLIFLNTIKQNLVLYKRKLFLINFFVFLKVKIYLELLSSFVMLTFTSWGSKDFNTKLGSLIS